MVPEKHYCIPPLDRVDLGEIQQLIQLELYFLLHAPRQTGKTSTLEALADHVNASGNHRCVYVTIQGAQHAGDDLGEAIRHVLEQCAVSAEQSLQDGSLYALMDSVTARVSPSSALMLFLTRWAAADPRPLVLLVDEIDALGDGPLLSVMDQLRSGHRLRPRGFPQSVVLCGQHNVRDYRFRALRGKPRHARPSPLNIVAESLRLGDFSPEDVRALLAQHTVETGQRFEPATVERVWHLTRGQPWLVNALCYQACFKSEAGRDRSRPVRTAAVEAAKEALVLSRVTHLAQLAAKLGEGPVRRVIEPLLAGSETPKFTKWDLDYTRDLGLVAPDSPLRVANPIYREVIPRELTFALQEGLDLDPLWYRDGEGALDMPRLLQRFQSFFRRHSEHWSELFGYREAGPHLLLQAYLQRVVNSGGSITREYSLGRLRSDLLIVWPMQEGPARRYVIECKVVRPGRGFESAVDEARDQVRAFMDRSGAESGHVAVFDLRPGRSWDDRIFRRNPELGAPPVTVWGL